MPTETDAELRARRRELLRQRSLGVATYWIDFGASAVVAWLAFFAACTWPATIGISGPRRSRSVGA